MLLKLTKSQITVQFKLANGQIIQPYSCSSVCWEEDDWDCAKPFSLCRLDLN